MNAHAFTPVLSDEHIHAWGELYEAERLHSKISFITFICKPRKFALYYGVYLLPDHLEVDSEH